MNLGNSIVLIRIVWASAEFLAVNARFPLPITLSWKAVYILIRFYFIIITFLLLHPHYRLP